MKHTLKWMVVPYKEENKSEKDIKSELSNVLHKNQSVDSKVKEYNQILSKNINHHHPVIPKIEKIDKNIETLDNYYDDTFNFTFDSSPIKKIPFLNKTPVDYLHNIKNNFSNYRENLNDSNNSNEEDIGMEIENDDIFERPRNFSIKQPTFKIPMQTQEKLQSTKEKSKDGPLRKRKHWEASNIHNSITDAPEESGTYRITTRGAHFLKKHGFAVRPNYALKSPKKFKYQEGHGWESYRP